MGYPTVLGRRIVSRVNYIMQTGQMRSDKSTWQAEASGITGKPLSGRHNTRSDASGNVVAQTLTVGGSVSRGDLGGRLGRGLGAIRGRLDDLPTRRLRGLKDVAGASRLGPQ
jgi:hypothetical protein